MCAVGASNQFDTGLASFPKQHLPMRFPALLCLFTGSLLAQSVVVPAANATTSGTSGLNTLTRNSGNPRTYMLGINASELAGIPVGDMIVGVSFRAYSGTATAWPATNVSWNDYEISVGPCVPTASFTTTFASNFLSPPVMVRDGAMVIPATTYGATGTPKPWGEFYFNFQSPVPYTGGDLGLLFTHPGSNDTTALFLDVVASNSATHGVAMSASAFQAPTGGAATASFCINRIHYGYGSGCPGTNNQTPVLVENGDLSGAVGGQFLLTTSNVPANAPAIMVFGFGRITSPLPNGCNLLVPPMVTNFFLCDPNGNGTLTLAVPPGFGAFNLNAQALVLDAGAAGGYTTSNGVQPAVL